MSKYARQENGRLVDVIVVPTPLPEWAKTAAVYLARVLYPFSPEEFFLVPSDAEPGAVDNGDGTYKNPDAPVIPAVPEPTPDPTRGRNITWDEFLTIGMAVDATKINTILVKLPVAAEWGRKYRDIAGIEFADATAPGTRLKLLLDTAVAAGLIDANTVTAFLAMWRQLYPAMVP